MLPSQTQTLLPFLESINELGGSAAAGDVIHAVTSKLGVNRAALDTREVDCGKWGKRRRSVWRQRIHWVRQNAVSAGLLERGEYGRWTLSAKGRDSLVDAQPGVILTVYETPSGEVLWADAMTAAGMLRPGSVDLVFTSSPYPINSGRGYGKFSESEVIELIVSSARLWREALKDDGSIVINLKDVFLPKKQTGGCVRSLYQEKILIALCEDVKLHLADKFVWKNPSHLPDSPWVTVRRVRTNCDHENLFWLGKSPNPHADNTQVLVDPAPSTLATYARKARRGTRNRVGPSGQNNTFEEQIAAVEAGQSIKVIPRNVLEFSNANTHRELTRQLKGLGLPRHDAMMPVKLAEHFINFLSRENGLVHDPFFGSGTTGVAAQSLNRRFVGSDRSLAHLLGSALRFPVTAVF